MHKTIQMSSDFADPFTGNKKKIEPSPLCHVLTVLRRKNGNTERIRMHFSTKTEGCTEKRISRKTERLSGEVKILTCEWTLNLAMGSRDEQTPHKLHRYTTVNPGGCLALTDSWAH